MNKKALATRHKNWKIKLKTHLAKCGKKSYYYCLTYGQSCQVCFTRTNMKRLFYVKKGARLSDLYLESVSILKEIDNNYIIGSERRSKIKYFLDKIKKIN